MDGGVVLMTIDHTHPQRAGASKDPARVRKSIHWFLKRIMDIAEMYGGTRKDIDEWGEAVWRLTEKLLQKIERRNG